MKAMGQTALFAVTDDGKSAVCVVRAELPEEWFIEDVPLLCQWDDFPSGCECISTTMLLQYYGYDISPYDFIDDHVPTGFCERKATVPFTGRTPHPCLSAARIRLNRLAVSPLSWRTPLGRCWKKATRRS